MITERLWWFIIYDNSKERTFLVYPFLVRPKRRFFFLGISHVLHLTSPNLSVHHINLFQSSIACTKYNLNLNLKILWFHHLWRAPHTHHMDEWMILTIKSLNIVTIVSSALSVVIYILVFRLFIHKRRDWYAILRDWWFICYSNAEYTIGFVW